MLFTTALEGCLTVLVNQTWLLPCPLGFKYESLGFGGGGGSVGRWWRISAWEFQLLHTLTSTLTLSISLFLCLFVCFFFPSLGLHCWVQVFSSCCEWRLLSSCRVRASHLYGFSCCREWALEPTGFSSHSPCAQQLWQRALELGLSSYGTQA